MSYQTQPAVVITQSPRIRNENAEPVGGFSRGTKDMLITGAAVGVGAIGGYFLLDYLFKNNVLDKLGDLIPSGTVPEGEEEEEEEDKEANIAHLLPYDRTTRVNSYGNTGVSAYRGKKLPARLPPREEVDITTEYFTDPGFNQIFTDNEVYEVVV